MLTVYAKSPAKRAGIRVGDIITAANARRLAGLKSETAVTLIGHTRIGARCKIGPATTIANSEIGNAVAIPHSFLVDCRVAGGAAIGPFAYLRPESDIRDGAKVGTFVEVKKSTIHEGAKVPHLSYVGDARSAPGPTSERARSPPTTTAVARRRQPSARGSTRAFTPRSSPR